METAFLARCATCLFAIREPTLRCPKCNSPRLVLVTGAFPPRPEIVASITLVAGPKPTRGSDEADLARRAAARRERKEAKRQQQSFLRAVARQAKLERRTFALDVWRQRREAEAERRRQIAADRERAAEAKRAATEERRRSACEKWAQERREMAIRAQLRLEAETFRADRPSARVRRARSAARAAVTPGTKPWKPSPVSLTDRFGRQFPQFMAAEGMALADSTPESMAWSAAREVNG